MIPITVSELKKSKIVKINYFIKKNRKKMKDYTKYNYNYYSPDGAGRDKYIIYNNGGQFRGGFSIPEDKPLYPKIIYNKVHHSLRKEVPPVTYRGDGTGRDTYIL